VQEKYLRLWLANRAEGRAFVRGRTSRPEETAETPDAHAALPRPARWP
jgi:hypothetical protein